MDNKNKSLWDEMVSEVKKEFTPEEVKKMKKQKTKAAWWYQAGFYLLLAIAVAVGIIKCCMQIGNPSVVPMAGRSHLCIFCRTYAKSRTGM